MIYRSYSFPSYDRSITPSFTVRLLLSDNPIPRRALNSTKFTPDRLVITTTPRYQCCVFFCLRLQERVYTVLGPKSWHRALDTLHAFQCDLIDSTTNNTTSYSIQSATTQYYSRLWAISWYENCNYQPRYYRAIYAWNRSSWKHTKVYNRLPFITH
jgi:hypothetical protein